MAEPKRRARNARAVENDERILSAAAALIVERGVDSFGLRDVAHHTDLTYGALYGRYENVAELLVDVWCRRLGPEVERLVSIAASIAADEPASPEDIDRITEPQPDLLAAVHLCMVASRIDELSDVVPAQVRSWLEAAGAFAGAHADPMVLGLVGLLLGAVMVAPVHRDGTGPLTAALAWVRAGRACPAPDGPSPEPTRPLPYDFGGSDPVLEALLQAAVDVVARSGLAQTTLKRIGRVAGYSPSLVYSFYDTRDEMLVDVVTRCVWHSRGPSSLSVGASADAAAAIMAGGTSPDAKRYRRLTLEFLLSASHDERLAAVIDAADQAALAQSAAAIAPDPSFEPGARLVLVASRDIAVGVSLLSDLIAMHLVDWRLFCDAFVAGLMSHGA